MIAAALSPLALTGFREKSLEVLKDSPLRTMRVPMPLSAHEGLTTVIDGFWHSGNSFLHSSVSDKNAALMHRHDPAALRWGKANGLETLALIRDPQSTARSLVNRREATADEALDLWADYYQECLSIGGVKFIDFNLIASDYAEFRSVFATQSSLTLNESPDYVSQHKYVGRSGAFLPTPSVLRRAEVLYAHCIR